MKHKDDSLEWHDENELVRRLDVVEAVLNLADTIDDVIDVIMSVPTYTADRKDNSSEKLNNCETCRFELYCPEMCEGCCEWDSHYEPKDEPQTERTCDNCGTPKHLCIYCIKEDRMWTPQTERSE